MSSFQSHLISLPRGTVALDCDGVLLDFLSQFRKVASYALGKNVTDVENVYALNKRFGISEKEYDHVMKVFEKENAWGSLPALPGAVESAIALQEAGHRVVLVTAIEEKYQGARLDNLKNLGFQPEKIYCIGAHSGHTKSDAYIEEQPHAIVDDRLVYLKEAQSVITAHQAELVWVNDLVPQHGHTPEFVHHEVEGLHHWANPIASRNQVSFKPKLSMGR